MSPREAGPLQDATEDLLAQVLPVVQERMKRASTKLASCSKRLARDPGSLQRAPRGAGELEEVQQESETLGWVLGVLASASGDDLLLARREPYGIALVGDLVGEVLASEGRALEPDASMFPDVASRIEDGWRLPWVVGLLVRLASRSVPSDEPVRWAFERGPIRSCLFFLGAHPEGAAPLLAEIEAVLPGSFARIEEAGFGVEFPAEWFATTAGGVHT
ncbi:MAG: hypothetical protein AAF682_32640 [Planctomycetota bacterium]